ncbi:Rv3235 family protein [Scrofimicrobium sp. R131]|uniref:Rv3235 family protein n=1 Tax=Scrofimicrobium appendicitidis TaxID=3079930 RepID=A0AAU7V9X7_9ACTO
MEPEEIEPSESPAPLPPAASPFHPLPRLFPPEPGERPPTLPLPPAGLPVLRWDLRADQRWDWAPRQRRIPTDAELENAPPVPEVFDPLVWSRNIARIIFDILGGRRDLNSVRRWLDPHLYTRLRARLAAMPDDPPASMAARVRSARICQLTEHVVESSVVIEDQRRCRAVALRMEIFRGRWRLTALEVA